MPWSPPVYHDLSDDAKPKDLVQAVVEGPLREMRDDKLRKDYPLLVPALAQLKYELEDVSERDWVKLDELKVGQENFRSMIVVGVREVVSVCKHKGYWYEDSAWDVDWYQDAPRLYAKLSILLTQRLTHFDPVTPDNTPRQLAQALYDGPIVDVLLHNYEMYRELEALRQHLNKIGVRAWAKLQTMKSDGDGTFAQVIAGFVGEIIKIYSRSDGVQESHIRGLIQVADEDITRARRKTQPRDTQKPRSLCSGPAARSSSPPPSTSIPIDDRSAMSSAIHPELTARELADALLARTRKALKWKRLPSTILPSLSQLEHNLHNMDSARWSQLDKLKLGNENRRSAVVSSVREVLEMVEQTKPPMQDLHRLVKYSLILLANQAPRYHHSSCENTPEELVRALEDGPIVDILLSHSKLYLRMVNLQHQLKTITHSDWHKFQSMSYEGRTQPLAQLVAGYVEKIVEIYRVNEAQDDEDYLENLVGRTEKLLTKGREAVRLNKTHAESLSHRKSRIYRVDQAQW